MMATYNDNLHTTTSLYNTAVNPYKPRPGPESVYGGTKSMYNGGGYSGRRTPAGFDSKSMYGGMDEDGREAGRQRSSSQLKRSMSVHSKMARRNPQDILPDEPARSAQLLRQQQQQQQQLAEHQQMPQHPRQISQLTDKVERAEGYTSEQMYRYTISFSLFTERIDLIK